MFIKDTLKSSFDCAQDQCPDMEYDVLNLEEVAASIHIILECGIGEQHKKDVEF